MISINEILGSKSLTSILEPSLGIPLYNNLVYVELRDYIHGKKKKTLFVK